MSLNSALTPPGKQDFWCDSTSDLLGSADFEKFLAIYNQHTAETRANQENVTKEDVLRDRNLRGRMRAFFRDQLEWKLTGAAQAETVLIISKMVENAVSVLDKRNRKLKAGEIKENDDEDRKLLERRFQIL